MSALVVNGFDYSVVDEICRDDVREAAMRIRFRMARTAADIIDIGNDLVAVKAALPHGMFVGWLEAEFTGQFELTVRMAQHFMAVADRFGGDNAKHVSHLSSRALYALAAPSTPDEIVEDVTERAANGETFTAADIKVMKAEWAAEKRALKDKADRAIAVKQDFEQQLGDLRQKLNQTRDEADTLKHELARVSTPASQAVIDHATVQPAKPDRSVIADQANAIIAAWNKACPEARDIAMETIDGPVFDRTAAGR